MKLRKAGYMNGLNYCFNFSTTTQKNIEEIAENSKNQRDMTKMMIKLRKIRDYR